jgi:ABC-type uncharacterized transport system ATPase subunit
LINSELGRKKADNMDILLTNFNEKLELMIDSVHSCDFITLDTEFSGLNIGFEDQSNGFD